MPRHLSMWFAAGGAALASAALTYAVTRPAFAPATDPMRARRARLARMVSGLAAWRPARTTAGTSAAAAGEGPTHNRAFDAYRAETLSRLAEDERAFQDFLERLRHAKDRAEFDAFMAGRRGKGSGSP